MKVSEGSLLDTGNMLVDLHDLVSNIHIDAGIRLPLLYDSQRHFERVTWRNCDLVCEEPIEEAFIEDWSSDLHTTPKELPTTLAALQNGSRDFQLELSRQPLELFRRQAALSERSQTSPVE